MFDALPFEEDIGRGNDDELDSDVFGDFPISPDVQNAHQSNEPLRPLNRLIRSGLDYSPNIDYEGFIGMNIGSMNVECPYCQVLRYANESEPLFSAARLDLDLFLYAFGC